ncbi:hypothetical protein [Terrarubrum flagellatum]|uniref:hypothetical protein n=1 Tax=Terrirubrum flagellatum TaxID=2895980 RepID=UPI003144F972
MSVLTLNESRLEAPASSPDRKQASFWSRALAALIASRRMEAERQVAAYLARNGQFAAGRASKNAAWKQAADALPF